MKRMISPDQALELVLARVCELPATKIKISNALGLVLAEEIFSDRDYPPFARAMMDGYAVRIADAGREAKIVGEVAAGETWQGDSLRDGSVIEIMTGAPCPAGTQAVVPVEVAVRNGSRVKMPDVIESAKHITPQGKECLAKSLIAGPGDIITPLLLANLATFGYSKVCVISRPSLAIITTGSEVQQAGDALKTEQIRNSNGPMLQALGRLAGLSEIKVLHAADNDQALDQALSEVADCNIVALSGGVSAGKYDLVPGAIERLGARLVFHKVTQQPGKPLLFAQKETQLFFGLPGNPLASHFCFYRYIMPSIRLMSGRGDTQSGALGILTETLLGKSERTFFQLCDVKRHNASWIVQPLCGKGSADIFTAHSANAYLRVEPGSTLDEKSDVEFHWIGDRLA